jgi:hypothetical protein
MMMTAAESKNGLQKEVLNMDNDNNFWTFISKRLKAEAALADWRLMLGDNLDFDKLQRQYLTPTGKMANLITCPDQCNLSCGFRKVCEFEGKYEAVCRERMRKDYTIEKADALFFTVKASGLLPEITKILKIIPHLEEFGKEEDTWKLGVIPIPGGKSATVYLTLKVWNHEIMDLIYRLNCEERKPYILLVTARKIIHSTSEKVLNDMGSAFVPLNEVLDFNAQTEFELIRECNLPQLVTPVASEPEPEPENIFRKCGDAWEVRYNGGEKFLLTGVDTGARYIQYLLEKPNMMTPISAVMYEIYGGSVEIIMYNENLKEGYSLREIPSADYDNIADDHALRQYKEETEKIRHDLETAKSTGDNTTAEQLEQDLNILYNKIDEVVSAMGQKKSFTNPKRKLVDAFRRMVVYTIDRIKKHDKVLAEHLTETIKYGQHPGYLPDRLFHWDL